MAIKECTNKDYGAQWRATHPKEKQAANRRWRAANLAAAKDGQRRYKLQSKYGMTPEDYEQMLNTQDGKCAICGHPPGKRRLAVDHDHTTKAVRGLLCTQCNRALGLFRDNLEICEKAASYLRPSAAKPHELGTSCKTL